MNHPNLLTQNMTGKAVMEELDQYLMASSTHSEGENILPEHFKNYPSSMETSDRNSRASKIAWTTETLEHLFKNKHTDKNKSKNKIA